MIKHFKLANFLSLSALAFGAIFFASLPAQAQQTPANVSNTQLASQVSESRARNQKLMRQYSWTSRTEVKIKGESKVLKSEAVHYSPDGQLVKAPLGQADASGKKTRGVRGRIAKKKKEKMRDWAGELNTLLQAYTLPTAGKVLDFVNAAEISKDLQLGRTQIRGVDVVKPGDSLTFILDSSTKALLETNVQTQLEDDPVLVKTVHRALDSGLSYIADSTVTVPGKEIEMTVQNFSFIKN